jgi:hypothetical protein
VQAILKLDGAQHSISGARELNQKCVSDCLDLGAPEQGENGAHYAPVLLKHFERLRLVLLRERSEPHDVSKHDDSEPSLSFRQRSRFFGEPGG